MAVVKVVVVWRRVHPPQDRLPSPRPSAESSNRQRRSSTTTAARATVGVGGGDASFVLDSARAIGRAVVVGRRTV